MDKLDQIKQKIEEIKAKSVLAPELKAFSTLVVSVAKILKDNFDTTSKENKDYIKKVLEYITEEHTKILSNVNRETSGQKKDFESKLAELKKLVGQVKDGKDGIDGQDGLDGKDGKDGSPDTRKEIVEKINTGTKKDLKIELAQIEGLEKSNVKLSDSIINRAIGIVDQRTSFLINKINNLPTSGGISLTDLSAGTGISYDNTTGVITNSAPDQTVALTAGTNITSITGTYPNFTINAATQTTDISGKIDKIADPNANRLFGWDDTDNDYKYIAIGTNLAYDHATHTLSATAGGTGDVVGPASAVDSNFASFNTTTGKLIKDSGSKASDFYSSSNPSGFTSNTGTVTSVAALTLGTTGTDLSSTVATGTTTPVITLNVPDASTTARGVVTTGTQSFTGAKTFVTPPVFTKGIDATAKLAFDVSALSTGTTRTFTVPDRSLTIDNITTGTTTTGTGFLKGNGSVISFDNSTYLTSLSGAVLTDQTSGQTIGATGARLTKLWATDITVTNAIAGSITGNAATVTTNANLTGDVTSTGNATTVVKINGTSLAGLATGLLKNTTTTGVPSIAVAGTDYSAGTASLATGILKSTTTTGALTIAVAGDFPTLNQNTTGSAATLTTTRTIWGQNFNGSANVTGDITLGTGNITMTGSLAATGARATKLWATDIESTNMPTVGGTAILTSLTAPQFTTIELGHATDTTLSRVSAGVVAIEGVNILTTAGGTLTGNLTLGENTSIDLDPTGSADGKYSGICITGTAGAALAFGDLIYLAVADSRWELTDADATATAGTPLIGMCVLAAAGDGSATKILLQGTIRADAKFPALTIGAPAYVGETAGAIQTAIPTGADNVIRVVGRALTADELYFCPSQDHQITVA
ncbi:hypothetical protein M0R04_14180 [Candidatus Dojkabacteria bacterium]|jgi:hypothetical protein|nr:hypothetical protein [Candidatus Dojkabacteria bacterium]